MQLIELYEAATVQAIEQSTSATVSLPSGECAN